MRSLLSGWANANLLLALDFKSIVGLSAIYEDRPSSGASLSQFHYTDAYCPDCAIRPIERWFEASAIGVSVGLCPPIIRTQLSRLILPSFALKSFYLHILSVWPFSLSELWQKDTLVASKRSQHLDGLNVWFALFAGPPLYVKALL